MQRKDLRVTRGWRCYITVNLVDSEFSMKCKTVLLTVKINPTTTPSSSSSLCHGRRGLGKMPSAPQPSFPGSVYMLQVYTYRDLFSQPLIQHSLQACLPLSLTFRQAMIKIFNYFLNIFTNTEDTVNPFRFRNNVNISLELSGSTTKRIIQIYKIVSFA